ncbi:MAG TPA: isocitrate lyase/phosphoenolpyruvate mutase family protein [Terriglobales bacterium]|nr:isocitrate lyase/phosphoenolpyruvate mutase family protein [Terriglobales bacterium]
MNKTVAEKRAAFRALHQQGCFMLPNPWDAGSARMLQELGFLALASTSSGSAWTSGKPDYAVTRDEVLQQLTTLSAAVDLPVNADYETGFAGEPEELAKNVTLAVKTGVAGLSIEDRVVGDLGKLYDTPLAVERLRAARAAIDKTGEDVILVARTEGLLIGGSASDAIDKLVAFADAGADCLYAPGIGMAGLSTKEDVATLVKAVAPKPVNILAIGPEISFAEYTDLGVRRLSVGGALSLVGWAAFVEAAKKLKDGYFDGLAGGFSNRKLNEIFGRFV